MTSLLPLNAVAETLSVKTIYQTLNAAIYENESYEQLIVGSESVSVTG